MEKIEPIKFKVLSPEDMQRAIINNTDVPMGQAVAKEAQKDTLRQVVEMLEKENTIKWKTVGVDHCGLLLTMNKWQEIRQQAIEED